MLQKTKTFLLGAILATTIKIASPAQPDIPIHTIYDDPWRSLEYTFVIAPESEINSLTNQLTKLTFWTVGTAPGALVTHQLDLFNSINTKVTDLYNNYNWKTLTDTSFLLNLAAAIFATGLSSKIATGIVSSIAYRSIYLKHFKEFIVTWPAIKDQYPKSFHKIFDHVHAQYLNSGSNNYLMRISNSITPKILQAVYERFPTKYHDRIQEESIISTAITFTKDAILGFGLIIGSNYLLNTYNIKDNVTSWVTQKLFKNKDDGGDNGGTGGSSNRNTSGKTDDGKDPEGDSQKERYDEADVAKEEEIEIVEKPDSKEMNKGDDQKDISPELGKILGEEVEDDIEETDEKKNDVEKESSALKI
jgi:hypothetical protein